jgi:hypothetical protein
MARVSLSESERLPFRLSPFRQIGLLASPLSDGPQF